MFKKPSIFERVFGIGAFISYLLTAYFKLETGKGLFMLNPCHITNLVLVYLLISPNSRLNQSIHSVWCSWIFGAYLALLVPHL